MTFSHPRILPSTRTKRTTSTLMSENARLEALLGLSPEQAYARRREWSRLPLTDLFPRIPAAALETILDICVAKGVTYNTSEAKRWSARRFTSIVVAHVRHNYTDYDDLLRKNVERYDARLQTAQQVWKVLKEWCPWESSNDVLKRCFQVTLLRPEERKRAEGWDPMDIDSDSEVLAEHEAVDDPMDLD